MAGAKFYYNLSDSLGEVAAKTATDTVNNYNSTNKFTTPKNVFTIHNYYTDTDANYEYITPTTLTPYGGWASYENYAIAQDKFYYKNSSSSAYTSFKFVHKLSAPLLRKTARGVDYYNCQAPFDYHHMLPDNVQYYGVKIYWNNSNNSIKIDTFKDSNGTLKYTTSEQGYGVFILLSGGGGGGGGGDKEHWGQGHPGGGGGGGGGTALMYFDAKKAYDLYPGSYLLITIGVGGKGGKGSAGFTAGTAGRDSVAELKNSSGTTLRTITCEGGKGGAGHAWDAAADSAGGEGGKIFNHTSDDTDETSSRILYLLDYAIGGKGGAVKRGSNGSSGGLISSGNWNIPFNDSWGKRDVFGDGSGGTCSMGLGTSNNYEGGGGGGCGTGYKRSSTPLGVWGMGMGGYGGYCEQDGLRGDDGICCIFMNFIPGVTSYCNAKKV